MSRVEILAKFAVVLPPLALCRMSEGLHLDTHPSDIPARGSCAGLARVRAPNKRTSMMKIGYELYHVEEKGSSYGEKRVTSLTVRKSFEETTLGNPSAARWVVSKS